MVENLQTRGFEPIVMDLNKDAVADLAEKGAGMIDAPLGRTPAHAKDGLLNIMASGDQATFDKVKPVLDMQGENIFYLGALGTGHTTKLINNFMGMTTVAAISPDKPSQSMAAPLIRFGKNMTIEA